MWRTETQPLPRGTRPLVAGVHQWPGETLVMTRITHSNTFLLSFHHFFFKARVVKAGHFWSWEWGLIKGKKKKSYIMIEEAASSIGQNLIQGTGKRACDQESLNETYCRHFCLQFPLGQLQFISVRDLRTGRGFPWDPHGNKEKLRQRKDSRGLPDLHKILKTKLNWFSLYYRVLWCCRWK